MQPVSALACTSSDVHKRTDPNHNEHASFASPRTWQPCRSEQERFRRRDLLHVLKNRREQIQQSLKRQQQHSERAALMAGSSGASSSSGAAKETQATAQLDSRGLLQLQEQVMKQQDRELEQMEKTVVSTKVRLCAYCEPTSGLRVLRSWCSCALLLAVWPRMHPVQVFS